MAESQRPRLQINLLGVPEVLLNGEPVSIQRRQVRLLLYFLACQRDPVKRTWLSDTFWSNKSDQDGREALRDALRRLRQALPLPDLIQGPAEMVMLQHPDLTVDVRTFDDAYQQLARKVGIFSQSEPLPITVHQEIETAVTLWRSNELMHGIDAEPNELHLWLTGERYRLADQRTLLLSRLADHEMACGNLHAALRWLGFAAEGNEDDPDLQLLRMRCLEGLGRWGDVMFVLDRVESQFSGEMAGRMPPELAQYCQGVRRRASPRMVDRIVPMLERMINAPDMRFVGRQDMLRELIRAFMRGGALVLWGEAGAGKTRLVYQAYQQIEPRPRLLIAPCKSATSNLPFEPVIDLLRQSLLPEDWQALPTVWATQLSRLVPEVVAIRPEIGSALNLNLGEARPLLFQAFHELLLQISRNQRLLFFVDDAQWADEASLSLLAYLVNKDIFHQRGLLLLAARGEESNPALEDFLSRSPRQRHIQEMPLPPLNDDEIAQLVQTVMGVSGPGSIISRLAEVTGGNPLLLLEALRSMMLVSNPLAGEVLSGLPLSSGTHALVRNRLRALPGDAMQALNAAAVIGQLFSQDLLEQVSGLTQEALASALELLVKKHLIHPLGSGGTGQYRFIHDLFREAILAELSQPRRHLLHTRVAETLRLQMNRDPSLAAGVAQHFEAAGRHKDAFACWLQAGRHALRLMAPAVMQQDCQRAESLLLNHSHLFDDKDIYDLYTPWMRVSAELGNIDEAGRLSEMLENLGQQRANALLVGAALNGRSFHHLLRSDYPGALTSIQRAMQYLERVDDPVELVTAHSRLATIYEMESHFAEARSSLQRSIALARAHLDEDMHEAIVISLSRLAYVENVMGFPRQGLALGEEALILSRQHFFPLGELRGLAQMSFACFLSMHLEECLEYCRQGLTIAETYQYMRRMGYLRIVAARAHLVQGHLDESWRNTETGLKIGEEFGYPEMVMEARMLQGEHFRLLRDYPRAIAILRHGLDPDCDSLNALHFRYRLGLAMLQGGDPAGTAYIDEAFQASTEKELASLYLPILTSKAMTAAASGDIQQARQILTRLEREAAERHFGTLPLNILLIGSSIALAEGNITRAEESVRVLLADKNRPGNVLVDILCLETLRAILQKQRRRSTDIQHQLQARVNEFTSQVTLPEFVDSLAAFRSAVLGV